MGSLLANPRNALLSGTLKMQEFCSRASELNLLIPTQLLGVDKSDPRGCYSQIETWASNVSPLTEKRISIRVVHIHRRLA